MENKTNLVIISEDKVQYINRHFGARLRNVLNHFSVSIADLIKKVNVSRNSVYKYFDARMYPTPQMVLQISEAIGVPFECFSEDEFEMGDYVYMWDEHNQLSRKKIELKEITSSCYDSTGNRITNKDYSPFELISAKASNRKALNTIINFIKDSVSSVDEPTKQVILEMLFDDMKDVNEVVEEYNKFKNNE